MNWEALGAIGDLIAALAVVVTLVFLIKEIRQNSQAVSIAALRDATAQWNHWSDMLATSSDLADIVIRGNRSFRDLPEKDALRYGAFVQTFFDNASSYRQLVVDHRIEENLNVLEAIVRRRICLTGFREWWADNSVDYDQDFIDWVVGLLEQEESSDSLHG